MRRSLRLALVAAAGAPLIATFGPAIPLSAAVPHTVTIADPSSNTAPSQSFIAACDGMPASPAASQACDGVAIPEFNSARAKEGLGPIVLPDDFDTLTVPAQVLAITDVERVDRGLPPVLGLSGYLDGLAQQGADAHGHPPFPSPFGPGRAEAEVNWAGTDSALLGAFMWMYWDGPGSGNSACQSPDDELCWGHRHTILTDYASPIVMGAGVAPGSLAAEVVGGDTADPVDVAPAWAEISGTLTYGVSPVNVTFATDVATSKRATVTATSSGGSGHLDVGFQSGAPTWSVSPNSCDLVASGSCQVVVTFAPAAAGRYPGVLTFTDGTIVKTVALAGIGFTPQVELRVNAGRVTRGHKLVIHGVVTASPTDAALSHRPVVLQTKSGGGSWHAIDSATTGGRGKVTYRLHPARSAKYRLEVIGVDGGVQASSGAVKVRVTR
ncbi:MAG TPA: hypothetical protein VHA79_07090 [Mycobacteriales bacterium]|jgi:hypothetical protein|nr:hypothetical protein [Mycobacteriales bacterium]